MTSLGIMMNAVGSDLTLLTITQKSPMRLLSDVPKGTGARLLSDFDGQITIRDGERELDIRVATAPTVYGEMAVLRILDKTFAFPGDPWFHFGDPRLLLALVFLVVGFAVSWLGARASRS